MLSYFLVFYSAFLLTLAGVGLMIKVCHRFKFYDHPGGRKIHPNAVPTMGGIPVAIPFITMLWVAWYIELGDIPPTWNATVGITIASLLALAAGVYDDLKGSPVSTKFFFQIVIALVLFYSGFTVDKVTNPMADSFDPSLLKLPITIIWVLVITNAINLIDGLDGLAGGVVFFSAATFYLIVAIHGGGIATASTLILSACLLAFLWYNFSPARIFLGDTGSMFLGVVLAAVSIMEERKGTVSVTLMLPIVIMAFPIVDAVVVFFRRLLKGGNPFHADRGHIHHRLLDIGFTQKQVVLTLYTVCFYLGLMALILSVAAKQLVFWVLIILGTGFFIALALLKYIEDRGIKFNGLPPRR